MCCNSLHLTLFEGNRSGLQNHQACTLSSYLFHQFDSYSDLEPFGTTKTVTELSCEGAVLPLRAVTLFCVFLFSFLVFLRYQIYYGYPLQTYLEYPIIVAQGNFSKPCFGNKTGLIQHSKALQVGTVHLRYCTHQCSDVNPSTNSGWSWGGEGTNIANIILKNSQNRWSARGE